MNLILIQVHSCYDRRCRLAMSGFRDKLGIHEFDPRDFEIVDLKVKIPDLDPIFQDYRIVHISDIHLRTMDICQTD